MVHSPSTAVIIAIGCFIHFTFQNNPVKRREGEDFLDYIKRVDIQYCTTDGFCKLYNTSVPLSSMLSTCQLACSVPCKCDGLCGQFDDCCPDIVISSLANSNPSTCRSSYMKREENNKLFYFMTARCHDNFTDKTVATKCENYEESDDIIALTPVTGNNSVTYINKYCAICNWEKQYESWIRYPECEDLIQIPSSIEKNEIVRFLFRHPLCNIELRPPSKKVHKSLRTCGADDRYVISRCNVTGNWTKYDKDIEDACLYYKHALDTKYKNPFCYVCNTDELIYRCDTFFDSAYIGITNQPMTALLDFTEDEYEARPECGRGRRYDFAKKTCREIFCAEGKWLSNETTCIDIFNPNRNVLFKVFVVYSVGSPVGCPTEEAFENDIANPFKLIFIPSEFKKDYSVYKGTIKGLCHPISGVSNEQLTGNLNDIIFNMEFEYIGPNSVNLSESTNVLFNWTLQTHTISFESQEITLMPHSPRTVSIINSFDAAGDISTMELLSNLTVNYFRAISNDEKRRSIVINRQRTCPYVILSPEEFSTNGSFIHVNNAGFDMKLEEFSIINATKIAICADPYFNKVEELTLSQSQKGAGALATLGMVCTILSMVCSLTTFIIYCLLKSLRSLPGKNNMALVVNLFLAQAIFLLKIEPSSGNFVCTTRGILTHYWWLAALLWMNISSFHMSRVFVHLRNIRRIDTFGSDKKKYLLYMFYCQLVPIIFIGIQIIISEIHSGKIGYDSSSCFISNKKLVGLTFVLPIGIVILSNVVMFLLVVVSICRATSSIKMAKDNRRNLDVYFRLSTVTGVMWVFGFIEQWTGSIVMSYIFVIFNALQGVFIFVAFVCNRRVYKSFKERFVLSRHSESSSKYTM